MLKPGTSYPRLLHKDLLSEANSWCWQQHHTLQHFVVWHGQSFGKPFLPLGHVWWGEMQDSHISPCYQFVGPLVVLFAFAKFQIPPPSTSICTSCRQEISLRTSSSKGNPPAHGKKDIFLWLEARHSHLLVCCLHSVASNIPKAMCHKAYPDWKSPGSSFRTEAPAVIPNSL